MLSFAYFVALLPLLQGTLAQSEPNNTIDEAKFEFTQAQIVPDVLPSFNPTAALDVVFTDTTSMQQVNVTPGMNVTTNQAASQPQFSLNSNDTSIQSQGFVLVVVDADAPTPQNRSLSQFRHFLGGNFTINNSTGSTTLVNNTPALTEFVAPNPPSGSDPHRYVFLAYVQSDNFTNQATSFVNDTTPRANFNVTAFATDLALGDPIAGNFMYTGPNTTSIPSSSCPTSTDQSSTTSCETASATSTSQGV